MSNNSLKLALISDSSLLFLIQCPFFLFPPKAGLSTEFLTALCTLLLHIQPILVCSKNHIICIFTFPSKNVNFSGTNTLAVSIQSYLRRCSITLKRIVNHCVVHLKSYNTVHQLYLNENKNNNLEICIKEYGTSQMVQC